jgi:hypothetical protein
MIEDNIRMLRQAAMATTSENYEIEKAWGIVAGNVDLVDNMAYKAIASNHQIKILFREHVILTIGKMDKKFDFIMFYGNALKLNEFRDETLNDGGAYVQVSKRHLSAEPNLMVLVAPDDVIRNIVSIIEKSRISFAILQESQTTGFIDIDISNEVKLPNFVKSLFKPFYNANEVVLSTVLMSVEKKEAVNKVQSIATSNKVFVIDFRDIVTEDKS